MDATTAIQIGMAVALLLSFFASFLSVKTWKIGQVVLVFFVFLAAGVFWYLTAAALKAQAFYGKEAQRLRETLALEQKQLQILRDGREAAGVDAATVTRLQQENPAYVAGVRELEATLQTLNYGRGRVWTGVSPNPPAADGSVSIGIEDPQPHAMHAKSVVYVFEEGSPAEGAKYLGEFIVTAGDETNATLSPATVFTPAQLDRLSNSSKNWIIYEVMPADRNGLFADMDENELRNLVPEQSVEEYLKDGKPAAEGDPAERIVTRKVDGEDEQFYQRRLRDYGALFHELQLQFFVLQNAIEQREKDNALLDQTIAKTAAEAKVQETAEANLASDIANFKKEIAVLTEHAERLTAVAARLKKSAASLLSQIQQQGTELARLQLEAVRRIESTPPVSDTAATSKLSLPAADVSLVGP